MADSSEQKEEEEILIKRPWSKSWATYFFPCRFGQSKR